MLLSRNRGTNSLQDFVRYRRMDFGGEGIGLGNVRRAIYIYPRHVSNTTLSAAAPPGTSWSGSGHGRRATRHAPCS